MDVFVYGTLTDPERAAAVLPTFEFVGPATLEGLHRVDGAYPTLAPGDSVAGRILRTSAIDRLDRYEGVDRGLYVRVAVPVIDTSNSNDDPAAETASATVYVGDPGTLDAEVTWPGDGPFAARVERYCREHDVFVEPIRSSPTDDG